SPPAVRRPAAAGRRRARGDRAAEADPRRRADRQPALQPGPRDHGAVQAAEQRRDDDHPGHAFRGKRQIRQPDHRAARRVDHGERGSGRGVRRSDAAGLTTVELSFAAPPRLLRVEVLERLVAQLRKSLQIDRIDSALAELTLRHEGERALERVTDVGQRHACFDPRFAQASNEILILGFMNRAWPSLAEKDHLRGIVQRLAALLVLYPRLDFAYTEAAADSFTSQELNLV